MKNHKLLKASLWGLALASILTVSTKVSASIFSTGNDVKSILKSSNMIDDDWSKAIDNENLNASAFATATAGQSNPSSKPQWELNNSTGTNQDKNSVDLYPNSKQDKNLNVTNDKIWTTTRYRTTSQILTNYKLSISQVINTVISGDSSINSVHVYRMKNSDYNTLIKNNASSIPISSMEDITNDNWVTVYSGKNVADKGYEKTSPDNKLSQWQTSRQVVVNLDLKNSPDYKEFWSTHKYADVKTQDYKSMKAPVDDYVYFVQTEQTLTSGKISDDNMTTIPDSTLDTNLADTKSKSAHKTNDNEYDISSGTFKFNAVQNNAVFSDYRDWSNTTFGNYVGTTESYRSRQRYVGAEPQLDRYQRRLNISTTMHVLNATPMINNLTPLLGYTSVMDDTYGIQNLESDQVSIRNANVGQGSTADELFDGTKTTDTQAINRNFAYVLKAYVPAIYKDKLLKDPTQAINDAKVSMTTFKPNNVVVDNSTEKAIDVQLDKAVFYRIDPNTGKATTDMSNLNTDDPIYVYIPAKMNDVTSSNYTSMMAYYKSMQDTITHSFSIPQLNYHSQQAKINMMKTAVTTSYYKYGTAPDNKATGYTGDSQYVANPDEVKPETTSEYVGLKTSLIDKTAKSIQGWTYANQSAGFTDDRIVENKAYDNWFSYKRVYTTRIQKVAQYDMHKIQDYASISKTNPLVGSVDFIMATDTKAWDGYSSSADPDVSFDDKTLASNKRRVVTSNANIQSTNADFVSTTDRRNYFNANVIASPKALASETNNGTYTDYSAVRQYITSSKSVTINGGISFNLKDRNKPSTIDYSQKPWVDFEVSDKTYNVASPIADTDTSNGNKYQYSDNDWHTVKQPAERVILYNTDGSIQEIKTIDEIHEVQLTSPSNLKINGGDAISVEAVTKVTSFGMSSFDRTNHGYNLSLDYGSINAYGGLVDGKNVGYVGFNAGTYTTGTNGQQNKIYSLNVVDGMAPRYYDWRVNPTIAGLNVNNQKLLGLVDPNTTSSDQMLDSSGAIVSTGDNSSDVNTDTSVSSLTSNSIQTSVYPTDGTDNSINRRVYDGTDPIDGSVSLEQAKTSISTREQYTYVGHQTFNKSVVNKGLTATQTFGNYVQANSNQRATRGVLITPSMLAPQAPIKIDICIGGKTNENYFLTNPTFSLSTTLIFGSTRFPAVNDTAFRKSNASITIEPTNKSVINTDSKFENVRSFYNSK